MLPSCQRPFGVMQSLQQRHRPLLPALHSAPSAPLLPAAAARLEPARPAPLPHAAVNHALCTGHAALRDSNLPSVRTAAARPPAAATGCAEQEAQHGARDRAAAGGGDAHRGSAGGSGLAHCRRCAAACARLAGCTARAGSTCCGSRVHAHLWWHWLLCHSAVQWTQSSGLVVTRCSPSAALLRPPAARLDVRDAPFLRDLPLSLAQLYPGFQQRAHAAAARMVGGGSGAGPGRRLPAAQAAAAAAVARAGGSGGGQQGMQQQQQRPQQQQQQPRPAAAKAAAAAALARAGVSTEAPEVIDLVSDDDEPPRQPVTPAASQRKRAAAAPRAGSRAAKQQRQGGQEGSAEAAEIISLLSDSEGE